MFPHYAGYQIGMVRVQPIQPHAPHTAALVQDGVQHSALSLASQRSPTMTWGAQASQVANIQPQIRSIPNLLDVVNLSSQRYAPMLLTVLTQWISGQFDEPHGLPPCIVPTFSRRTAPFILPLPYLLSVRFASASDD